MTESLFLTVAVDAYERRDIMSLDIPNAYIQAGVPRQKIGKCIIMKVRGRIVDWLIELDPLAYLPFVVYENGVKTLYLLVEKAIYGMLEAGLLWYWQL